MNAENSRWPAFIIALIVTFVAFSCWSLQRAASGVSAVSDSKYYSHGLKYNATNIEIQTAQALRWTVTPKVQGRVLTVQVEDAEQVGVSGANGFITVQPDSAEQGPVESLPLLESGQGLYMLSVPAKLPKTFSASLTLTKDQATVQRRLLINLE
jgi:hypothetical protein